MTPKKAPFDDLVYATGRWKIYRQDAGMGEKDYCILRNGVFFCRTEHKQLARDICAAYDKSRSQPVPDALSKENITISAVCGYEAGLEAGAKAERERVLDLIRKTDGGACPYELCRSGNGHDGLNCRDCLVKWIEESLVGGEQGRRQ